MNKNVTCKRPMAFPLALTITLVPFSLILLPALLLRVKVQPLFLAAWLTAVALCRLAGWSLEDLQEGTAAYVKKASSPILILWSVGAMLGVWNLCGTIPTLTAAGVSALRASWFLPASFLICLLFGLCTGTVFGTCGTVGAVLVSVGQGMGLSPGVCAACAAAGAFLGYGNSPLADFIHVTASLTGVNPHLGLRRQLPAGVIASALALLFCALRAPVGVSELTPAPEAPLESVFRLGFIPVLPLLVVVLMLLLRTPTILSLGAGILSGAAVSLLYQGQSPSQLITAVWSGPALPEADPSIRALFCRGGMTGMGDTVALFLLAFGLFGVLTCCGALETVLSPLLGWARTRPRAAAVTVLFGLTANLLSASAICSFVFTLPCVLPIYEKHGWDRAELFPLATVGCMFTSLLIPWHSNIVTSSALLGVETGQLRPLSVLPALLLLLTLPFLSFRRHSS